jgi:VWFA-related protein
MSPESRWVFPFFANTRDCLLFLIGVAGVLGAAQHPQFKGGVERIVVDVQVVDSQGRPIPALKAEDFEVRVDQQPRTVVSVEFMRAAAIDTAAGGATSPSGTPPAAPPAGNTRPSGRDFILAIDESSFMTRHAPAAVRAARAFIERLAPADRVGLYLYPVSQPSFSLTPNHQAVLEELDRVVGTFDPPISRFHLSKSEVIDVEAGDPDVLSRVLARECSPRDRTMCRGLVVAEAHSMAATFEGQVAQSMGGLRTLFTALRQDPDRKTVVIVSGGLLAADRVGARPDVSGIISAVGEDAARASATIYVIHLDFSLPRCVLRRQRHRPDNVAAARPERERRRTRSPRWDGGRHAHPR